MGIRGRRAQDRAVAQLRCELELRREHGLEPADLEPSRHQLVGGLPPAPDGPRSDARPATGPSARRARTPRSPLLPGLAVVVALLAYVVLSSPGSTSYWAKEAYRRVTGASSTSYAFMSTRTATGEPVAWDRCRPIRYQVNPDDAPKGWRTVVDAAFAEVSAASGYTFADEGTTEDRDFLDRQTAAPVLLGWGGPAEFDELAGQVAGFGGATSVRVGDRRRYVTGAVLLDSGDYVRMAGNGRREAMRMILIHEVLHVLGLDHVDDPHQLMHSTYVGQDELAPGDVAGLEQLVAQPCA